MNEDYEIEKPKRGAAVKAAYELMDTLAALALHLGIEKDVQGLQLLERGAKLLIDFLDAQFDKETEGETEKEDA